VLLNREFTQRVTKNSAKEIHPEKWRGKVAANFSKFIGKEVCNDQQFPEFLEKFPGDLAWVKVFKKLKITKKKQFDGVSDLGMYSKKTNVLSMFVGQRLNVLLPNMKVF